MLEVGGQVRCAGWRCCGVGAFCIIACRAATLVTLRGADAIAKVTSWAFLAGTVLPGVVIMVLAVIWIARGNPIAMLHPAAGDAPSVMSMAGGRPHPRGQPATSGMGDIAFLAGNSRWPWWPPRWRSSCCSPSAPSRWPPCCPTRRSACRRA